MASNLTKADVQEIVNNAVETLAQAVNGAFEKQREIDAERTEQLKTDIKTDIMAEIDSRGYVTKHDLDDVIVDAKDEIIDRINKAVQPKLQNHDQRLVRLEQRV